MGRAVTGIAGPEMTDPSPLAGISPRRCQRFTPYACLQVQFIAAICALMLHVCTSSSAAFEWWGMMAFDRGQGVDNSVSVRSRKREELAGTRYTDLSGEQDPGHELGQPDSGPRSSAALSGVCLVASRSPAHTVRVT